MNQSANITKPIVAGLLAAVVFVVILRVGSRVWKNEKQPTNPFEYDLSEFRKIDPKLMTYDEISQINPELESLYALAVDAKDHIYVTGDRKLKIFKSTGQAIDSWELDNPARCIHIDSKDLIYLGLTDHIEVYDKEGSRQDVWDKYDEDAFITSITSSQDHLFVADAINKIVLHYDSSGNLLGRIGEKNPEMEIPGFIVPSPYFDLSIGYEGYLWIVNPGRHSLENYTFDGQLRSSWTKKSWQIDGFCGCCNPTHIAVLENGSFVTSEKGLPRVKIIDQTGNVKAVVAGPEQFGETAVGLDLAVDSSQRIIVLDPDQGNIRIFKEKTE